LNKFYLNGKIKDKHRTIFTNNNMVMIPIKERYNRHCLNEDRVYFGKYEENIYKSLKKTYHALFSMCKFGIFNPFGYYAYPSSEGIYGENCNNWCYSDFLKYDILKLFDNYNYMILLPGWWKCKEGWLKLHIAKSLGIKIITFKKFIKELN